MTEIATTSADRPATSQPIAPSITSDFETFLRMLTVQAENQDPLNPLDSSEFATQLASFSAVEQQVQTNSLLSQLIAFSKRSELSDLAHWVGMDAEIRGNIPFDGTALTFDLNIPAEATAATITVVNQSGEEVFRQSIDPFQTEWRWDGTLADGSSATSGTYQFRLELITGDIALPHQNLALWLPIQQAGFNTSGQTVLDTPYGPISVADVAALRSRDDGLSLE